MKTTRVILIFAILVGLPQIAGAQSDYEFYFFGVNLKSFQGANWLKVAAGAAASLLVHELGHALYLESQGKKWDHELSFPSGLAITTQGPLSDRQYRNFGRAGFALQTGIGVFLASIPATQNSDFTRGWVGFNSFQALSYNFRSHDHGDDFLMIERGGGSGEFDLVLFSLISSYNLMQTESVSYSHRLDHVPMSTLVKPNLDNYNRTIMNAHSRLDFKIMDSELEYLGKASDARRLISVNEQIDDGDQREAAKSSTEYSSGNLPGLYANLIGAKAGSYTAMASMYIAASPLSLAPIKQSIE